MTDKRSLSEWRIIGESVPGASHLRAGIPNQDAILQSRESARSLPLIISVSDGHGSDKCFRSDRGSRFAVKKAVQLVGEFLDQRRAAPNLAEIENNAKERLAQDFVKRWREAVEADLKRQPFTAEELDKLEKKDGSQARKLVEANPLLAYGATSLTVAVEESFILYLQLGDGDILTVNEAGEITKPLPVDERLFANETTSLCLTGAEKDFRFHLQKIEGAHPALILLSTDGYVNSFSTEEGFLKVGGDLLEMLRSDGFDFVNDNLKAWLEEATRMGSGDDTTVGLICRMDALKKPEAASTTKVAAASSQSAPEAAPEDKVVNEAGTASASVAAKPQAVVPPAQNPPAQQPAAPIDKQEA
jgi:serine/threonine protein phosphatase PrpC